MTHTCFGIRREDKSRWERRVPLTPGHVRALKGSHGIQFVVQPSEIRVFPDAAYQEAGVEIKEDLGDCPVVLAVKEIPVELIQPETTYLFFSHTIKGQSHNMPLLRRLMDLGCQLIDYERIVDSSGRRLVFFGRQAGQAGMIDTFWMLGQKLKHEGKTTPLESIRPAHAYADLGDVRNHITEVGKAIERDGLPDGVEPLVVGFAGYGNVSQGAQDIFDLLPHHTLSADNFADASRSHPDGANHLFKVVFREEHLVEPMQEGRAFDLQEYYTHPEKYGSRFEEHLPSLTALINCIYWEPKYPRLVTCDSLKQLFKEAPRPGLRAIGDITCDVGGSIECTVKATGQDDPTYTFDPVAGSFSEGTDPGGVTILAVDNLPCELPYDASCSFGDMLMPLLPDLAKADFKVDFPDVALPDALKTATVVYHGELTESYEYLEEFL